MIQEAEMFLLIEHFLVLIGLLEEFTAHVLVASLVTDEHVTTSHGKTQVCFFLLGFFQSGLFSHLLEMLEALVVLLVLFLDLVSDKAHILTSPDDRKLVRGRGCTC